MDTEGELCTDVDLQFRESYPAAFGGNDVHMFDAGSVLNMDGSFTVGDSPPAASVDNEDNMLMVQLSAKFCVNDGLAASSYCVLDVDDSSSLAEHSLTVSVYDDVVECTTECSTILGGHSQPGVLVEDSDTRMETSGEASGSVGGGSDERSSHLSTGFQSSTFSENGDREFLFYDCNQTCTELVSDDNFGQGQYVDCVVDFANSVIDTCPISLRLHQSVLVSGVESQLKPETWSYYLEYEDNMDLKNYLWYGVSEGFDIVDRDVVIEPYECLNYQSCTTGPAFQYVDYLIIRELNQNKFVLAHEQPHCVHSLGAIPKADGSFRPITDCKRPLLKSINNFMDSTFETFSYASTDQVCDMMTEGCFMATVDIASAYRSVSINPDQWRFQSISWPLGGDTKYLYDVRLSFGLPCAPFIFTQISNFVVRTMQYLGEI